MNWFLCSFASIPAADSLNGDAYALTEAKHITMHATTPAVIARLFMVILLMFLPGHFRRA